LFEWTSIGRNLVRIPPLEFTVVSLRTPTKVYRLSQNERSIFWEVIVLVILSKNCIHTCALFQTVSEIELFHCTVPKLLIRKRHYVQFLTTVFIVQATKLVQFSQCNTFLIITPSRSMHFATRVRTWRVARLYSVLYSEIAVSRKPFAIGHMYIYTSLLRITDSMASQNTDLSSWYTLYNRFPEQRIQELTPT
jgi:hypothetical protein